MGRVRAGGGVLARKQEEQNPGPVLAAWLCEDLRVTDPDMGPASHWRVSLTVGSVGLIFQYPHKTCNVLSTYYEPGFAKHHTCITVNSHNPTS